MTRNNRSNDVIRWIVLLGDFILLNGIILLFTKWFVIVDDWPEKSMEIYILVNNIALMISQTEFSNIIYRRFVGADYIFKRVLGLAAFQSLLAYVLLEVFDYSLSIGMMQFLVGYFFFFSLLILRLAERWSIKLFRESGRNVRYVTFVGNDPDLMKVYDKLSSDQTTGYRILGYYADSNMGEWTHTVKRSGISQISEEDLENNNDRGVKKLGTLQDLLKMMKENPDELEIGDELYVSISRRDKNIIKKISRFCDHRMVRFFYVPVSVESIGLNLKREMMDDIEVFTTYENPLEGIMNKVLKRLFDILMSILFLIPTALITPIIWVIVRIQSPGPLIFKQARTGLDGRTFMMYKFRSMYVNNDADTLQASEDDPRKFPFGDFMRRFNIDELPQFLNVLKGDMSIVGPRPHMLAHTEQYSELIDKYMVRHFVKPGLTGWAQVTGFRGETKELWQMEERVKRDIWYMEHWSIWLDIRIMWMTLKSFFKHDKNAY